MTKEIDVCIGGAMRKIGKVPVAINGAVREAAKGVAGVGGAVVEFFTSNPITSIKRSNCNAVVRTFENSDGTYLYLSPNSTGEDAYLYIYGDFGNKTYSIDGSASWKTTILEAYHGTYRHLGTFGYDEDESTVLSGTLPDGCSYIRFTVNANEDDYGTFYLYEFKIDGEDYLEYLYTLI